ADERIKGERDGEELQRLGKGNGGVVCREGAERGKPERPPGGFPVPDAAGEGCDEQARTEIDAGLRVHHGVVMLHAEELEAEHEEKRIAGESDERGLEASAERGSVDA